MELAYFNQAADWVDLEYQSRVQEGRLNEIEIEIERLGKTRRHFDRRFSLSPEALADKAPAIETGKSQRTGRGFSFKLRPPRSLTPTGRGQHGRGLNTEGRLEKPYFPKIAPRGINELSRRAPAKTEFFEAPRGELTS